MLTAQTLMSFLMNYKSRFFIFLYVGIWPYMCMIWIFVNCLFSLQAGRLLLLMLLMQLPWERFSAAFWCFPTKLPPKVGSSRCGQLLGGMLVIALSYSQKALSLGFRLVLLVSRCHLMFHKSFFGRCPPECCRLLIKVGSYVSQICF